MAFWLAGMRITASRLNIYSAQAEDPTLGRTTTSQTYTDASGGALAASVLVPASGAVMVEIRSTQRNSSATLNTITSWRGVGTVSGTVYTENDNAAIIVKGQDNLSVDLRYRLTGLTPGETLTVTIKHRVNSASTATFDYRVILLEGLP